MPSVSQGMKIGRPKLSELAKFLHVPEGIVSTGWPAVRQTCVEKLGVEFDPWQDAAGRVILAKRADGSLASMVDGVGLSLPRQVGKTFLVGFTVFALCVNMPGLLVIWTAHHSATSGETFLSMQGMAQRSKVAPHVRKVFTGSGDEEIRFHNGSRILFGARERGFGRGIPGVDVLIFDEAQILSDKAMSNMLATLNTSKFGLQLFLGTPPKPDDMSESFKRMRREALAGSLTDGAWIEFGADPDADDEDRAQWRMMNPSYPKRTPAQSLMRLKRKLTRADWRREGMGIWDDDAAGSRLISADDWLATGVDSAPVDGVRSFGVAFNVDGSRMALAGAVKHSQGVHVEIVDAMSGDVSAGVSDLAKWLADRWRRVALIAISGQAGSAALAQALLDEGVPQHVVHVLSGPEVFAANGMFYDGIRDGAVAVKRGEVSMLTHPVGVDTDHLERSVMVCDKKFVSKLSGAWRWSATVEDGDETPLEAVSFAHWAARTSKRDPDRKQVLI